MTDTIKESFHFSINLQYAEEASKPLSHNNIVQDIKQKSRSDVGDSISYPIFVKQGTPLLYFNSHYVIGNTSIQLCTALIISHFYGHQIIPYHPEADPNVVHIDTDKWDTLTPFLGQPHPIFKNNINLSGYFQTSEWMVHHRELLITLLSKNQGFYLTPTVTVRDILYAPSLIDVSASLVVHIRLGDFNGDGTNSFIIDPAAYLRILRGIRLEEPAVPILIVCAKPRCSAEENYLRLFEEFHPRFQHGTDIEDFAVLRSAERIICSNSTFAWFAAFLGTAKRWIAKPIINELWHISEEDTIFEYKTYDIRQLDIPSETLMVSGEFLQSLCEFTLLNEAKKTELHKWIDWACPIERQIYADREGWRETLLPAASVFVFPETDTILPFLQYTWPSLKVLMIHNSDNVVSFDVLSEFLERHQTTWIWLTNQVSSHPRIRLLPLGEQNRLWREGRVEAPRRICRTVERDTGIYLTWMWPTHPTRTKWSLSLDKMRDLPSLERSGRARLHPDDYEEKLGQCAAVICPPGNGADTHRHWETHAAGAWMILEDNPHTRCLKEQYPSLPCLLITELEELRDIVVPPTPAPFHPMILREFWRILFRSH